MNNKDIDEMFDNIKIEYEELTKTIEEAKSDEKIISLSTIKIKHLAEDIRSCLDYMAEDIIKSSNIPTPKKIYFPYGKDLPKLLKICTWLNDLKIANRLVYDEIINNQDFNLPVNEQWIIQLCNLNIQVKHKRLERPVRKDGERTTKISNDFIVKGSGSITIIDSQIYDESTNSYHKIDSFVLSNQNSKEELEKVFGPAGVDIDISFDKVEFITSSGCDVMLVIENSIVALERMRTNIYNNL